MAQSLSKIYVHIIFSTKNRMNLITKDIAPELYAYIASIIKSLDSSIIKIGGVADHIHILCVMSKTHSLSKLIEEIKKNSSKWIKTKGQIFAKFSWQKGYGGLSISPSHVDIVSNYINNQFEHHKKISFQDELRKLLKKYNINYDEKYLWD